MNIGANFVLPGALIGSLVVASLGLTITSDVKAEALFPAATNQQPSEEASAPGGLVEPEEAQPEQAGQPEDLFEASIAFTPDIPPDEGDEQHVPSADCRVSGSYPQSILQWCEFITHYADQHDLPPNLIAAVMLQESGGKPLAYSHSGAVGLMQVMPSDGIASKFMCKNGPCFTNRPTIAELENPEFNVSYGTRMLAGLVGRFGNFRDALKSYGPMDVGYSYADKVLAIFERYSN
jgi:soluble lytic murein transglycosylase-like protein